MENLSTSIHGSIGSESPPSIRDTYFPGEVREANSVAAMTV